MKIKKLFTKKSGFSLVEIIIAFAIFAIFALIIAQVISLTISQRSVNDDFEKYLANQELALYTKQTKTYDASLKESKNLTMNIGGVNMNIPYMVVNPAASSGSQSGNKEGLNYFVGKYDYSKLDNPVFDSGGGGTPGSGDAGNKQPQSTGEKYDARITATPGIKYVELGVTEVSDSNKTSYTITVDLDPSGISADYTSHAQVTLLFGPSSANATLAEIVSVVNNNSANGDIKKSGKNGVNIHGQGSNGLDKDTTYSFTVTFKEPLDLTAKSFGTNGDNNGRYSEDATRTGYLGVYAKETTSTT